MGRSRCHGRARGGAGRRSGRASQSSKAPLEKRKGGECETLVAWLGHWRRLVERESGLEAAEGRRDEVAGHMCASLKAILWR